MPSLPEPAQVTSGTFVLRNVTITAAVWTTSQSTWIMPNCHAAMLILPLNTANNTGTTQTSRALLHVAPMTTRPYFRFRYNQTFSLRPPPPFPFPALFNTHRHIFSLPYFPTLPSPPCFLRHFSTYPRPPPLLGDLTPSALQKRDP